MKSAYELAMEKLRRQDAERGESPLVLSEAQKAEIAELRRVYTARQAEREILLKSEIRKARATGEPDAVRKVEENARKEQARLEEELESRIEAIRKHAAGGD